MKCVIVLALAAEAALASAPSVSQLVLHAGLTEYQVFQRDESGHATMAFTGSLSEKKNGHVVGRVLAQLDGITVVDWQQAGPCKRGNVEGTLQAVPTGGPYVVELRVLDEGGKVLAATQVRHVLVGDLWLLAGQSNMEGLGELRDAEQPSIYVHSYGMDEKWSIGAEPLHWLLDSPDPVHHRGLAGEELVRSRETTRRTRQTGAGLGLPFAKELVARTGVPIGLIPCAHGGTAMEQWDPAKRELGGASLYGSMYRRFRAVGGKVRGVLWYQGEAETNQSAAALFRERFLSFVARLRSDFGDPKLPFYYVQIGRYVAPAENQYWNAIRELQRQCAGELENAGMVASIDLPLDDPIHVSTVGHKRLGRRLALLVLRDMFGHAEFHAGPQLAGVSVVPFRYRCYRLRFSGVNVRLCSQGLPAGFSLRDAQGRDLRLIYKTELGNDGQSVDLFLREAPPPDAQLWYGGGVDPYCNVTDELDMALAAFGPIDLARFTRESFISLAQNDPRDPAALTLLPQVVSLGDADELLPLVRQVLAGLPEEEKLSRSPYLFALGDLGAWDDYLAAVRQAPLATRKQWAQAWTGSVHFAHLPAPFVRRWQVVGPFDNADDRGLNRPSGPERFGLSAAPFADGLTGAVSWQNARAEERGYVDLTQCFSVKENAVGYALAEISAAEEVEALALLGSDDGVAVWVNGELVHKEHIHRAPRPAQDLLVVRLRKGTNTILVKVEQVGGDWGFYLQLVDRHSGLRYE